MGLCPVVTKKNQPFPQTQYKSGMLKAGAKLQGILAVVVSYDNICGQDWKNLLQGAG